MLKRSRILIATLWVGVLWTVGFIVAPTLFSTLADRALAGTIAGNLFRVVAWLSVACAAVLLILQRMGKADRAASKPLVWVILGMVACTLVGYFSLQPHMAELRVLLHGAAETVQMAEARKQFGILHAVSTGFYVLQSLLGVALILKIR